MTPRPAPGETEPPDSRPSQPADQAAVALCPRCGGRPPILNGRLTLRIGETAQALGVSRDFVELLINTGALEAVRIRSIRMVTVDSLLCLTRPSSSYQRGRRPPLRSRAASVPPARGTVPSNPLNKEHLADTGLTPGSPNSAGG